MSERSVGVTMEARDLVQTPTQALPVGDAATNRRFLEFDSRCWQCNRAFDRQAVEEDLDPFVSSSGGGASNSRSLQLAMIVCGILACDGFSCYAAGQHQLRWCSRLPVSKPMPRSLSLPNLLARGGSSSSDIKNDAMPAAC
jgi:hypothetical protein